jgi:Rap1a immunity proteins
MRRTVWFSAALLCVAGLASPASAVTQDDFLLRNTADLVNLCSAPGTDPLATAAVNFCEGFGLGVFRVLDETEAAHKRRQMFCMPSQGPTRTQAIMAFVQWAKAAPDRLSMPPTDSIATYLSQQYPCPRG